MQPRWFDLSLTCSSKPVWSPAIFMTPTAGYQDAYSRSWNDSNMWQLVEHIWTPIEPNLLSATSAEEIYRELTRPGLWFIDVHRPPRKNKFTRNEPDFNHPQLELIARVCHSSTAGPPDVHALRDVWYISTEFYRYVPANFPISMVVFSVHMRQ